MVSITMVSKIIDNQYGRDEHPGNEPGDVSDMRTWAVPGYGRNQRDNDPDKYEPWS